MLQIQKVAVLGAGVMGNQIAMQIAVHGYPVACYDNSGEMVAKAEEFSKNWFRARVEKGKMGAEEAERIQKRLEFTTDVKAAASGADMGMGRARPGYGGGLRHCACQEGGAGEF